MMQRATAAALLFLATVPVAFAQGLSLWPDDASLWASQVTLGASEEGAASASPAPRSRRHELWAGDPRRFFTGAFVGFLSHETGHVIANYALGTDPYLKDVEFSFIPFFTIQPGHKLSQREHYITASAGFNAQFAVSEWLLSEHPNLQDEDEPFLKGLGNFNFWLGVGYAASAFAGYGPDERDTKGMADSLGWSEDSVGALILTPTLLDAYRYRHPECKWARDASRLTKLLLYGLIVEADGR